MPMQTMKIDKAVSGLTAGRDAQLAIRPSYWRGSGEALVLHGGNLYRVGPNHETLDGPPYVLGASELVGRWHLLPLEAVRRELEVATAEEPPKSRRQKKPAVERRDRRGRPSAGELRAELPEGERDSWLGVTEAARIAGVGKDRIRRAVAAGELSVRLLRGVTFVDARAVGLLGRPVEVHPAPAEPEVFS